MVCTIGVGGVSRVGAEMSEQAGAGGRRYSAPALEKGLDVLELLAESRVGLTQSAIAAQLGRSVSELFRMLAVLEGRGYIYRQRPEDLYYLSLRLYELAHRHPPTKRLLDVAIPEMRSLAHRSRQSCHLGVPTDDGELLIIAQVDSPESAGITVQLGRRSLLDTASGRVLLAHQPDEVRRRWLAVEAGREDVGADQLARLDGIAQEGSEEITDESLEGVTDLSYPVLDFMDVAIAALTVPYLHRRRPQPAPAEVRELLAATVTRICAGTRGTV